ncbi:MAG: APC family permease [Acidobacteria bacterium]|nr:APC family permease [Acidobacteriota bacterium]
MSQPEGGLRRVLKLRHLLLYGIIVIQPTAPLGSFGVVATVAQGHVATTLLIAMVAMVLTAVSYGRMSAAYPKAGSAYSYVSHELHPNLGFLTGWSIALDYVLNPTIGTIWCAKAAMNILPVPFAVWVILFAALFTWLNLRGIETNVKTNTLLTAGMGVVLVAFFIVATGYLVRLSGWSGLLSTQPFYDPQSFSWPLVSTGTSIAVLTYMGFDSISTLSEDVENPRRNVLLATVLLCVITGVLGTLEVYFGQLIWPDFRTFPDPDTAYVSAAGRAGGPWMFHLMNFTLLVATMGSSLGAQLGAGRLLYAMGRDNVIPRGFFAYLDPVRNTPRNNILLCGVLVAVGALSMSYQTGAELLNFGAFVAFMGVNLAALVHYYVRNESRGFKSVIVNLLPPLLGFVVCLYIWWSLRDGAKLAGAAWLLAGLLYWAWRTNGFRRTLMMESS